MNVNEMATNKKSTPGSFGALPASIIRAKANGNIAANDKNLTSLEGSPDIVIGGFNIDHNQSLKSLVGGPKEVNGDYSANNCGLTSLVGFPAVVGHGCYISDNPSLTSMEGGPEVVIGEFKVNHNPLLTSLIGGPKEVGDYYCVQDCGLISLEGLSVTIGGYLSLDSNPLTSLSGINKLKEMNGSIYANDCPITSHILGVFFIKGCLGIRTMGSGDFRKAVGVVNRHISKGRAGLLACQKELIEAGLADFAQI
jgi:hypothetical protein